MVQMQISLKLLDKASTALEDISDAGLSLEALPELIDQLEMRMRDAAKNLDFEQAANLRDRIKQLRQKMIAAPDLLNPTSNIVFFKVYSVLNLSLNIISIRFS